MEPLLQYRRRSRSRPSFAAPELYDHIRTRKDGQLTTGINVRFRARAERD